MIPTRRWHCWQTWRRQPIKDCVTSPEDWQRACSWIWRDADQRLGVSGALALWIAAVRECFEEAGVLLAHTPDGHVVELRSPDVVARFDAYRRDVHHGRVALADVLVAEGLRIAADRIHYWSHWVTPIGPPRRRVNRYALVFGRTTDD